MVATRARMADTEPDAIEAPRGETSAPAARAIAALRAGRPILLVDHAGGHTYLVAVAERVTDEFLTLSAVRGRGVLKVAMSPERVRRLRIPALPRSDCHAPVDLAGHDRGGIPADRIATLRALADPSLSPDALIVPGQVFPVATGECHAVDDPCVARVMAEAAGLAGCERVAAYSEVTSVDGEAIAGGLATARVSRRLGLPLVGVRDLLVHRERVVPSVSRAVEATIPTPQGGLTAIGFVGERSGEDYVAFVAGEPSASARVHVHRRCPVGDVFGCLTCGCGEQLRGALNEIQSAGSGMIVYCDASRPGSACPTAGNELTPSWDFTAEVAGVLCDVGVSRIALTSNALIDAGDLAALGIEATLVATAARAVA
jgi:3,4-dihydroxy 2-butanone 4-phosphate synthase / GTP cyclohydrolase II